MFSFQKNISSSSSSCSIYPFVFLLNIEVIYFFSERWNKKLNYVIAIAKDGVCDVTKRYTRKWFEVISV